MVCTSSQQSCLEPKITRYIRGVCNVTPLVKPNAWAASAVADRFKRVVQHPSLTKSHLSKLVNDPDETVREYASKYKLDTPITQVKYMWTKPTFKDIRLGFEVTCYVMLR